MLLFQKGVPFKPDTILNTSVTGNSIPIFKVFFICTYDLNLFLTPFSSIRNNLTLQCSFVPHFRSYCIYHYLMTTSMSYICHIYDTYIYTWTSMSYIHTYVYIYYKHRYLYMWSIYVSTYKKETVSGSSLLWGYRYPCRSWDFN